MAHKKGGGSSRNGRESNAQRLGVKRFGGELVIPGNIIVRQRGTHFHPGIGVGIGKDHTIFATVEGIIIFERMRGRDGQKRISVYPPAVLEAKRQGLPAPVTNGGKTADGNGSAKAAPAVKAKPATAASAPVAEAAPAPVAETPSPVETPVEAPAKVKAAKPKKAVVEGDDLQVIEGIGPKVAGALRQSGITTFAQIAQMTGEQLYQIVKIEHGVQIVGDATATWPKQAKFLVDGDMDGLKAYQDRLVGGREPSE